MNGGLAKAIRKGTRRAGWKYIGELCRYSFWQKLNFCWFLLTHKKA